MADAERMRLTEADEGRAAWKQWGPYLSERAWGTVREDYSSNGDAWNYFPHDHARSRAYRWNEDGLAGICDKHQLLCFSLAFWNGNDPILKERIFGLSNPEGNHGEDQKEYWWYLDSTPTHSWMRWRYMYAHAEFPYKDLIETNRGRSKAELEYELVDTGVFDDNRYFEITADYAKGEPDDICILVKIRNAGPEAASIEVLPTVWFRNTWSWGIHPYRPQVSAQDGHIKIEHSQLPPMTLSGEGKPTLLFCENDTNVAKLFDTPGATAYPKDGIGEHIIHASATVNPSLTGTKACLRYTMTIESGETEEIKLRLSATSTDVGQSFEKVMADRQVEANEFYEGLTPEEATEDETLVMRQAFAGLLWGKQFYHYDVSRWLDGDPAGEPPAKERLAGRNWTWRHLDNYDIVSMPDKWEYPWYAAWDLAFHCVPLAHVDPAFAKAQLLLILREWFEHPNGQIPAYEWNFSDVNPPVHGWAALKIFDIDGGRDFDFLERVFHKLMVNFTWWVNKKDRDGNNVFEGGFLGLDNIGPIDRSSIIEGGHLEQSDGTSWMAMYALDLMRIAIILAKESPAYEDIASKFFEHFVYIAAGINSAGLSHGLWDDEEGFYYDLLHLDKDNCVALEVRSMVGLIVLFAVDVLDEAEVKALPNFVDRRQWFLNSKQKILSNMEHLDSGLQEASLLSIVSPHRLRRILKMMLDENEFLSPFGIRALSKFHETSPLKVNLAGINAEVSYEPAESSTGMFGGNSNWRGPIWMPVNYLLIDSLRIFGRYLGDRFTVEHPTGSGVQHTLAQVCDDLSRRIVATFARDASGRRPVLGDVDYFQNDPAWRDLIPFHEYFHGDTGRGVGASHQTGWTGLVADLITTGAGCSAKTDR